MLLAVCPNPSVDTYVWVDSLEPGKVHRASLEKRFPGGKGVHVALAAAELNEETVLLGFWGGETGMWIRNECEKRNIICVGPDLKEWSRSCFTFKSEGIYDDTELLGTGPIISADDYREFTGLYDQFAEKSAVITLSGSWLKGAPDHGYADLIRKAKNLNKPVFLDATGENFKQGLNERPFAVHLNYVESKNITGLDEIGEIIGYFKRYADLVAVTMGQEGLFLDFEDTTLHGKVVLDKIYSAVGSGDCLTAGLALAMKNNMNTEEMLRLGVACGGANCLRKELGMLYQHDVKKLIPQVEISYP